MLQSAAAQPPISRARKREPLRRKRYPLLPARLRPGGESLSLPYREQLRPHLQRSGRGRRRGRIGLTGAAPPVSGPRESPGTEAQPRRCFGALRQLPRRDRQFRRAVQSDRRRGPDHPAPAGSRSVRARRRCRSRLCNRDQRSTSGSTCRDRAVELVCGVVQAEHFAAVHGYCFPAPDAASPSFSVGAVIPAKVGRISARTGPDWGRCWRPQPSTASILRSRASIRD